MKPDKHYRRLREPEFAADPDFAEALSGGPSESNRQSAERQAQRKARQLCRQVHQALSLALAGRDAGGALAALFVEEVSPAPDCSRLLVEVSIPEGRSAGETMAALRRETPRLRTEVAMAITRKRAPELMFVPSASAGGDGDE